MKTPRFFKIPAGGPAEVPYRLIYNIFFRFAREKQSDLEKGRLTPPRGNDMENFTKVFEEKPEIPLPFLEKCCKIKNWKITARTAAVRYKARNIDPVLPRSGY